MGLVAGEVDSGKTGLCRKVAASLNIKLHKVSYLPLTTGNVTDIYKSIVWGLPPNGGLAALYRSIRLEVNRLFLELKIRLHCFLMNHWPKGLWLVIIYPTWREKSYSPI